MRRQTSLWQNIDWVVIVLFGVLVLFGLLNIYATNYDEANASIFNLDKNHGKQIIWIGTAFVLAVITLLIDQRFFEEFSWLIYGFGLLLLMLVLVFGVEIKGAKSWFVLPGIGSFQPAEIAKLGTALALSRLMSVTQIKFTSMNHLLQVGALLGAPVLLILLQPDAGSTLVYFSFIFVLFREGLSWLVLLIAVTAGLLFVAVLVLNQSLFELPFGLELSGKMMLLVVLFLLGGGLVYLLRKFRYIYFTAIVSYIVIVGFVFTVDYAFNNILGNHQRARINELLGLIEDPNGVGYNVKQSKIAIGSGGFTGKGFLEGTQTKGDFVPEQSTDFIFCTVGEEWGFIGSFVVIALFITLLFRLLVLAERQKSKFARLFGYCITGIFFFHFSINIGMTLGLAPVIGIPLPFFSYGGSSLWAFTILIFSFLRMDSERNTRF